MSTPLDLLVVAPHPDDAEIGAGGTIAQWVVQGKRVGIVDLTTGEPTPFGSLATRAAETEAASRVLGICWRQNLGLPNRSLEPTLEARRAIAQVFRLTSPRLILAPYWEDAHPDHIAASQLVEAARFWSKLSRSDLAGEPWWPPRLLYYFSIHLRVHPEPSAVVDISKHIETKMQAIGCYQSQFVTGRPATPPTLLDDIRDRARYWGWSISRAYGEPFASREELGLPCLDALL
jgi:bacillithiol biosynthesis deacetylase BshB1